MFPEIGLVLDDIESSWAGLRPLIYEEGKSASEISRKDEIFVSSSGLVSMAGGKLTGYRKMAEKVVDRIARDLQKDGNTKFEKCKTLRIPLTGNKFQGYDGVLKYIDHISDQLDTIKISKQFASYLVHNYGKQTDIILGSMDQFADKDPELRLIKSEIIFCLEQEMVCKPLDFIERRTGRLYFWIETIDRYKNEILKIFYDRFGWSNKHLEKESKILQDAVENCKKFV
jgi:glycerol-3-phosphate dehydrogenase